MRAAPLRFLAPAALAAAAAAAACGPASLSARAVPFPAGRPVFVDSSGTPLANLPRFPEPVKLVVIDAPWCPPCAEAWKAVREASASFPPGSVRVYRILFDRERRIGKEEVREVPPREPARDISLPGVPVTTLTALPAQFRDEFRLDRFPVILIIDRSGGVARRWTGSSPALSKGLGEAVSDLSRSAPPPGT